MKRRRKQAKTRHLLRFPAFKIFPPSDLIGIDLLCLMSAYNDLVRITDWMHAHYNLPRDPLAVKIDNGRSSMEWRYIIGVLHEVSMAFQRMTKNNNRFPNIECRLDNDGRNALKELQKKLSLSVTNAPDPSLAKFLEDVRNRGAFHYVRDHYQQGLRALKRDVERNPAHSVEAMEDCFIFEGIPVKGVWRFVFADTVRNAAAFGLNEAKGITEQLQANLEQVTALIGHLNQFLQSAFIAYVELRGFDVTKTNEGFKIHKKESP